MKNIMHDPAKFQTRIGFSVKIIVSLEYSYIVLMSRVCRKKFGSDHHLSNILDFILFDLKQVVRYSKNRMR